MKVEGGEPMGTQLVVSGAKIGQLINTNLGLCDVFETHSTYLVVGCLATGEILKLQADGHISKDKKDKNGGKPCHQDRLVEIARQS